MTSMTSSSGDTTSAPTRSPPRSEALATSTPSVARPLTGYSDESVRLARPFSNTTKTSGSVPSSMTFIASSESPSRNFMPVTPEVERPIGRSVSSVAVKRTD